MKRGLVVALLSAAVLVGAVGTASADTTGKLGVGFDQTLGGASGLTGRYFAVPKLSIQAVLSYDLVSADDASASELDLGLRGLYAVLQDESFQLDAGGGLNIIRNSVEVGGNTESNTGISIELGVGPTWWATDHFALNLFMGLLIDLDADGNDGTFVGLFEPATFTGRAGFIWIIN